MYNIKLTITPKSFLLLGSGEGSALIDTDIIFHKSGFPYLPARRVKGLFKESFKEVLEMEGKTEEQIEIEKIKYFGNEGDKENDGMLNFQNLYIIDWKSVLNELETKKEIAALYPDNIKKYFTTEIQQTAIEDGIAEFRSLRNYRVLVAGNTVHFEGNITINRELINEEIKLLSRTALNLRYAGTRRNRGFGKINCEIGEQIEINDKPESFKINGTELKVNIKTISSVVIADNQGEQNTVFTQKDISGNHLRGMLAGLLIRKKTLKHSAHNDPVFFDWFLSGKLTFGNCLPSGVETIPLNIHKYKGQKESESDKRMDVFRKKDDDMTRTMGGYGTIENRTIIPEKVETSFFFHSSRDNRTAGRSTKNDGDIFYYEAIDSGQEFIGTIKGETELLNSLINEFGITFKAQLGKSRSAQYGEVEITLSEPPKKMTEVILNKENKNELTETNTYILIFQSPVILFNENGMPEPTSASLKEYFSDKGLKEISHFATNITHIEQYNSVWQAKSGKLAAYNQGSTFKLKFDKDVKNALESIQENGMGELISQGFGKVKFINSNEFAEEFNVEERKRTKNNPKNKPVFANNILKSIYEKYNQETCLNKLKEQAINAAENKGENKINNHLIGRIEHWFKNANSLSDIKKWLDDIKGKSAEESLKKADLLNELEKLTTDFKNNKIYWLTYLQTLRKINKRNNKSNEQQG